jgi:neutral ceramidase
MLRNITLLLVSLVVLFGNRVGIADESKKDATESLAWKVGAATIKITPEKPIRMAGYASRVEPAEGTEQDLFAKAIAIEDKAGNRVVFVTTDLIGILAELRSHVEAAAKEQWNLPAHALLMNASHTHCGPAYGNDDDGAKAYFAVLKKKIVTLVGQAIENLEPASLFYSHAKCSVAMNRRTPSITGFVNHPNPNGPVDHSVPVLSARDAAGKLKTVVFGYACHNTTMGFRRWLGDYAGFAQ